MKNILITGGAGFIGTSLGKRLIDAGHRIRILDSLTSQVHGAVPKDLDWLDSDAIDFIRGSVTNRDDWAEALEGIDCVVHLAAETGTGQSMYEVGRYNFVNVQGTALMFDVLTGSTSRTVKRIILASSRSVYGEGRYQCLHCHLGPIYPSARNTEQLKAHQWEPMCPTCGADLVAQPTREIDLPRPASFYAATKYAQEDLVRVGCSAFDIGYAIFRLQNVFGEGQSLKNPYTGILSIFSTKLRHGMELPLFEDGKETRDFVHVDDVVAAIRLGIDAAKAPNDTFNVGSGVATSIADVADLLSRAFGKPTNTVVTGQYRKGDIRHNVADIRHISTTMGYQPRVDLATGLSRFANWVMRQPLVDDLVAKANSELSSRNLLGS